MKKAGDTGIGSRDLGILLILLLIAAIPRLRGIGDLELTHFDESAYAMSALALAEGEWPEAGYPKQHFLAPPVLFTITGAAMKVTGSTSATVLFAVVAVFGILTVLLIYLLGCLWNNRGAGFASAVMLALSGFHITYSRVGLTDVVFLFFFLLALLFYTLAEKRERLTWAVLAGLAVGLAWNTKYHGWLAGVAAASAIAMLVLTRAEKLRRDRIIRFAISVLVACLVYAPWFVFISEQEGGYARLMAEHRNFLRHPSNMGAHFLAHSQAQLLLDGWIGRAAPLLALFAAAFTGDDRRAGLSRALIWAPATALAGVLAGQIGTELAFGLLGLFVILRRLNHAAWLQIAFFGVFSGLTLLYFPYVRLLLPWVGALTLLAGAGVAALVAARTEGSGARPVLPIVAAALLALNLLIFSIEKPLPPKEPMSRSMRTASEEMAASMPLDSRIDVDGEPAVVFHLRRLGYDAHLVNLFRLPEGHLSVREGERRFLVVGRYPRLTKGLERVMAKNPKSVVSIGRFEVEVGLVRLLNDFHSAKLRTLDVRGAHDLELFEITGPIR